MMLMQAESYAMIIPLLNAEGINCSRAKEIIAEIADKKDFLIKICMDCRWRWMGLRYWLWRLDHVLASGRM